MKQQYLGKRAPIWTIPVDFQLRSPVTNFSTTSLFCVLEICGKWWSQPYDNPFHTRMWIPFSTLPRSTMPGYPLYGQTLLLANLGTWVNPRGLPWLSFRLIKFGWPGVNCDWTLIGSSFRYDKIFLISCHTSLGVNTHLRCTKRWHTCAWTRPDFGQAHMSWHRLLPKNSHRAYPHRT